MVNGELKSLVMPPLQHAAGDETPTLVPGPDVIVGRYAGHVQSETPEPGGPGGRNDVLQQRRPELNWFRLPNTDHPVIPQNLYRMSGGASNNDRFEQIGQSWLKHAFTALQQNACGFGCTPGTGTHLGVGCSDPYGASLNASQSGLGSRAWVNPFTGAYPIDGKRTTRVTRTQAPRTDFWSMRAT